MAPVYSFTSSRQLDTLSLDRRSSMRLVNGFIASLALAGVVVPANAQGILFVQKETRGGQSTTAEVQLDKTHMRADAHDRGGNNVVIYDATKQVISMVDMTNKTYREVNKA